MLELEWLKPGVFVGSIAFALIGVALFWLCFIVVDKITPYDLWGEIVEKKNVALAIVVGALAIGIALVRAASVPLERFVSGLGNIYSDEVLFAAHHVRDEHGQVVDHASEVVQRHAVAPQRPRQRPERLGDGKSVDDADDLALHVELELQLDGIEVDRTAPCATTYRPSSGRQSRSWRR